MTPSDLSDKALAVFAFALYHQLSSGEPVSRVVIHDGAGHQADPDAIAELAAAGLASVEDDRLVFSASGLAMATVLLGRMRGADR